eukprot:3275283-Amphidinium_carterae.2
MDENLLRISPSWNRVDPMGDVRVKAQPGRTDPGGEAREAPQDAWVQASRYRSVLLPSGTRAWMRVDDGFVQHQQLYWCEIPEDLPVEEDLTPNWEEELPARPVPRP